jgi:hypothetical protein
MKSKYRSTKLALAVSSAVLAMGVATSASAADVTAKDGWGVSFDGLINAFVIKSKDSVNNFAGTTKKYEETRIASGWDPSKFNAHISAPKQNGLTVTGNFQFVAAVTNGGKDNPVTPTNYSAGSLSAGAGDTAVSARVLDINIAGDFGTVAVGRSWGIFNSQATISEYGSGNGVGALCGGVIGGGGTCGRIGYGYTWTAFAARVEYDTPNMGGFSARVGLFDPTNEGGAYQAKQPRLEAEATFAQKNWKVWAGLLNQKLDDNGTGAGSAKLSGTDVGGNFTFGGLGVTAAYTSTKGFFYTKNDIGCGGGTDACKFTQYYVDVSYTIGASQFGVSHGKGQSKESEANLDNTLDMVYLHQNLTKQLVATVEFNTQVDKTKSSGAKNADIKTFAVGAQYNF